MIGWHHRLSGYEFEQAPGDGEGQGSLACCSPLACKELDMTEQLNNNSDRVILDKFKITWSSNITVSQYSARDLEN